MPFDELAPFLALGRWACWASAGGAWFFDKPTPHLALTLAHPVPHLQDDFQGVVVNASGFQWKPDKPEAKTRPEQVPPAAPLTSEDCQRA